jgi:hypothetical protein
MDDVMHVKEAGSIHPVPSPELAAADWVSTNLLDYELWNAITEEYSGSCEDASDYDDTDELVEPEEELMDEAEERNRTLRLLADLRPQLAELLSKASER